MKTAKLLLCGLIFSGFLISGCSSGWELGNYQHNYSLSDLNQYGEWVVVQPYGSVWRPFTIDNWEPFDYGHWSYIDNNWTWMSYEPFGWIVYHYGNWFDDPTYGWVWVPSYDSWSPGKVQWLINGDYISWAPLPPEGITYKNPWEEEDHHYWHVVFQKDFNKENINNYLVNKIIKRENDKILRNAPLRELIESKTKNKIENIKSTKTKIIIPKTEIHKLVLPRELQNRIEKNQKHIREKVMVTRKKYHENKRNEKSKK